MQDLSHHIQTAVRERFPDSVYTAIGGWVFLRHINPAIISPELVDLEMPEDSRKALVMISKVSQVIFIPTRADCCLSATSSLEQ